MVRMDTTSHAKKSSFTDRAFGFVEGLPIGDRFLLKATLVVFFLALLWLAISFNSGLLVNIPSRGGALREGVVGTPRFINPVLAVTAADQDLTTLVYSGLMTLDRNGEIVPDIAESVEVSEDGLVYAVTLRDGVTFHDDAPLLTDDVIFTVSRVQDPATKSPIRASWEGITMERENEREMRFILPEPYAPFVENLTLGILPKHIWEGVSAEEFPFSQNNSEPIGAGPYKIDAVARNDAGIPESYELEANRDFFKTAPRIKTLTLRFYPTEKSLVEAMQEGAIESAGGLSPEAIDNLRGANVPFTVATAPLPRTFTLFFNQNELSLFRETAVRQALEKAVDRNAIVEDVLRGYGTAITSPIPPGFNIEVPAATSTSSVAALDAARELLRDGGWRMNEESGMWEKTTGDGVMILTFSITTANAPVFEKTAQILKAQWKELGVPVTIKQFEQSDLIESVIRPRQYEALLFGTVVGRELDFYSFWHSSQRNDPGLNVALYANIATDALLSSARAGVQGEDRTMLYQKFSDVIEGEVPAIFLYVPSYTYVTSPEVRNVSLTGIARGSERLCTVSDWFMETDSVWPFFTDSWEKSFNSDP